MPEIAQLIKKFESDIKYDCHSTVIKISRSIAAQELVEVANHGTLAILVDHLRANPPSGGIYADLPMAWCMLLNDIGHRLNIKPRPDRYNDLPSWLDWATQNSQTSAAPAA